MPRRVAMTDFVQLWVYLSAAPLFGLTATLVAYVSAAAVYDRVGRAPWAKPVLWSVACLGGLRIATGTPYPTYFAGAQFVHVLLGPAVVALAWPLWQRRAEVRRRGLALVCAALVGGLAAGGSAVALAPGLRPAGGGAALARIEVGHRTGGDGHRRAHRRRASAGGGVYCHYRAGGCPVRQVPV